MKILKFTYTIIKLILDASGVMWPDKWISKFKKQLDSKCLIYFQKLHAADNDAFAIEVRPLLYWIAGLIVMEAFIFNMIPVLTNSAFIKEMVFTSFFVFLITFSGFLSKKELGARMYKIYVEVKKGLKYVLYIAGVCLVLAAALDLLFSPVYKGKELNAVLTMQVTWDVIKHTPTVVYLIVAFFCLFPFVFILVQFGFARLVIRIFRKVIALILEKSSKDPLKIIYIIVAAISVIELGLSIFIKQ